MTKSFCLVALVCAIVGFDAYIAIQYLALRPSDEPEIVNVAADSDHVYFEIDEGAVTIDKVLEQGGEHFGPLRLAYDVPGVENPRMLEVAEAELADTAYVIGVEVNGEAFAFSMQTMDIETNHIINLLHQQTPITVTYCPLANCVRVLTRPAELIPLKLGGLNDEDTMVVMLDGVRYDLDSPGLPLTDYAYARTTYGKWKRIHPETKVFTDQSVQRMVRQTTAS